MAVGVTLSTLRLVTALGTAANTAEGYVRPKTTVEKGILHLCGILNHFECTGYLKCLNVRPYLCK